MWVVGVSGSRWWAARLGVDGSKGTKDGDVVLPRQSRDRPQCGAKELNCRFPGIEVGGYLGQHRRQYRLRCRLPGEADNCGAAGAGRGLGKMGIREITARNISPTDSQLRAQPSSQ